MCSASDPLELLAAGVDAVRSSEPPLCGRAERLAAVSRQIAALEGVYLRELGIFEASGEFELENAGTAGSWVRRETGRTEREAALDLATARRLRQLPLLAAALQAGELQRHAVELVAKAALQLPAELIADTEPALVQAARLLPVHELARFLAEKIAALAPDRLRDAVESAYERRRLHLSPVGDVYDGQLRLEPLHGERLAATLDALMESDRVEGDVRSRAQRRADALVALLDLAAESPQMPKVREALPQLIVVVEEGRPARTTGGIVLTDGQLDLVSCAAVVTTVVVDEERRPLDVGRSCRSLSRRLWLALLVRDDGHCQVAGCNAAASRCIPHHIVPWRLGGPTDQDNLVILCVAHHHALHDRELHLLLYDGRTLTPTGSLPVGTGPPPHALAA